MVRPGVGLAFPAGAGHVAGAVLIGAEKRSTSHHSLGHSGLGGVRGVGGPDGLREMAFAFACE